MFHHHPDALRVPDAVVCTEASYRLFGEICGGPIALAEPRDAGRTSGRILQPSACKLDTDIACVPQCDLGRGRKGTRSIQAPLLCFCCALK